MDISSIDFIIPSGFAGKQLRLRDKIDGFTIDLCDVPDKSPYTYELAVFHDDFGDGTVVIVGYAASEDEARALFLGYCTYISKAAPYIKYLRDVDTGEIYERKSS